MFTLLIKYNTKKRETSLSLFLSFSKSILFSEFIQQLVFHQLLEELQLLLVLQQQQERLLQLF